MNQIENASLEFSEVIDLFIQFLESKSYKKSTLINYRKTLEKIGLYMKVCSISNYSEDVGLEYYNRYIHEHKLGTSRQAAIHTVIHRLNDFYLSNEYFLQAITKIELLPSNYEKFISQYILHCYRQGNKDNTIKRKCQFVRLFLKNCITQGCSDVILLNPSYVMKACAQIQNKDAWAAIKDFLKFINSCDIQSSDFSILVPRYKRPINLPVTYSESEISRIEKEIDRESNIGKRDYALILLATRLGLRSGDIVNLTFDSLDFNNDTITFNQQKTGELLRLTMLAEVRDAIIDYINNSRPEENSKYIFLRQNAPFRQITTSVIRFETTRYFKKAGINIVDKKHGPHVFRSSLASSMINNDTPYEIVRKILGHTNPDSIKNYARVDIEKLREFAIEVPEPSGYFKIFLEGGTR